MTKEPIDIFGVRLFVCVIGKERNGCPKIAGIKTRASWIKIFLCGDLDISQACRRKVKVKNFVVTFQGDFLLNVTI